jgi:hypothetical protein
MTLEDLVNLIVGFYDSFKYELNSHNAKVLNNLSAIWGSVYHAKLSQILAVIFLFAFTPFLIKLIEADYHTKLGKKLTTEYKLNKFLS